MTKVMAFGTFDILHPGHLHMLREARSYGSELVVIIARDATVKAVKGRSPINNENIRLHNVEELNIATKVRLGAIGDKHQVIKEEQPDIVALGYDQRFFIDELEEQLKSTASIVRLAPLSPEKYKSSKVINA